MFFKRTNKPSISSLSHEDIIEYSRYSYCFSNSDLLTAQLVFHGLWIYPNDLLMTTVLADLNTEKDPNVAAVFYFYIYKHLNELDNEERKRFMVMFSDAMYQYNLSKHKYKENPLRIKEIMEYDSFKFDIEGLEKHAKEMIKEFKTIENFIEIMVSSIGMGIGFLERKDDKDVLSYLKNNMKTTVEYNTWINSWPSEMSRIMKIIQSKKK